MIDYLFQGELQSGVFMVCRAYWDEMLCCIALEQQLFLGILILVYSTIPSHATVSSVTSINSIFIQHLSYDMVYYNTGIVPNATKCSMQQHHAMHHPPIPLLQSLTSSPQQSPPTPCKPAPYSPPPFASGIPSSSPARTYSPHPAPYSRACLCPHPLSTT
jgi:hypothetical protein